MSATVMPCPTCGERVDLRTNECGCGQVTTGNRPRGGGGTSEEEDNIRLRHRVKELEQEVGRLRAVITNHRDELGRLSSHGDYITRELHKGSADLTLWSVLDEEAVR